MGEREKFAVIIPDRGDRPAMIKHCFDQIARMTLKPDKVYHINFPPVDNRMDLVERVYDGVQMAKADGFDLVFILENDDYYPADYFERVDMSKAAFFGHEQTYYYNVKERTFNSFYHVLRSSLFTTGFRISCMDGFQWGGDQFLDIRIWDWARKKGFARQMTLSGAIGIKHGIGLCGGKGHKMKLKNCDPEMKWLRERVDRDSYLFYAQLSRELWQKELA
jgi:hypothetical protein